MSVKAKGRMDAEIEELSLTQLLGGVDGPNE